MPEFVACSRTGGATNKGHCNQIEWWVRVKAEHTLNVIGVQHAGLEGNVAVIPELWKSLPVSLAWGCD